MGIASTWVPVIVHAAILLDVPAAAMPNTCQPRTKHPFMPIYHIIGNVSSSSDGTVTRVEAINDVSSAFLYKGIYHVFHQCCQNHWDHVVSKGALCAPCGRHSLISDSLAHCRSDPLDTPSTADRAEHEPDRGASSGLVRCTRLVGWLSVDPPGRQLVPNSRWQRHHRACRLDDSSPRKRAKEYPRLT